MSSWLAVLSPNPVLPSAPISPYASSGFGAGVVNFSFLLSVLIWAPLLIAVLVALIPERRLSAARRLMGITFWTNLALLLIILIAYHQFNVYGSGVQFEERLDWLPDLGVSYHLGINGVGMSMLLLNAVIGVVTTLLAFDLGDRARQFFVLLLVAESFINGTIAAQNLLLLLLFWSALTFPIILLVKGWGGPDRSRAAASLHLYWAVGNAALILAGLLLVVSLGAHSLELSDLNQALPDWRLQIVIASLVIIAAASRLPLFPLQGGIWRALSVAHPAVAVLLIGAAARLGGDLLFRLYIAANHGGAHWLAPLLAAMAVLTVVYAGLMAFKSSTLRRQAAWLAIMPGGITALGVAALSPLSLDGAAFSLMVGGLAAALVIGVVAVLAGRLPEADGQPADGMLSRLPKLTWLLIGAALGLLGIPFLATSPALLMVLLGAARSEPVAVFLLLLGLLIAGFVVARLLAGLINAPADTEALSSHDATLPEQWAFGLLIGILLWVGLMPGGPKVAGNPVLEPGLINVVTQAASDLSAPFVTPPIESGR